MRGLASGELQRERHARAARADEHLRRQLLERLGILRRLTIAAREMELLKVAPCAELSRSKQSDQVVELTEIILQRCCREQQQVVAIDLLNEPIRGGTVILHLVRLIDDDEVPSVA